jgi:hypothetical protein
LQRKLHDRYFLHWSGRFLEALQPRLLASKLSIDSHEMDSHAATQQSPQGCLSRAQARDSANGGGNTHTKSAEGINWRAVIAYVPARHRPLFRIRTANGSTAQDCARIFGFLTKKNSGAELAAFP